MDIFALWLSCICSLMNAVLTLFGRNVHRWDVNRGSLGGRLHAILRVEQREVFLIVAGEIFQEVGYRLSRETETKNSELNIPDRFHQHGMGKLPSSQHRFLCPHRKIIASRLFRLFRASGDSGPVLTMLF